MKTALVLILLFLSVNTFAGDKMAESAKVDIKEFGPSQDDLKESLFAQLGNPETNPMGKDDGECFVYRDLYADGVAGKNLSVGVYSRKLLQTWGPGEAYCGVQMPTAKIETAGSIFFLEQKNDGHSETSVMVQLDKAERITSVICEKSTYTRVREGTPTNPNYVTKKTGTSSVIECRLDNDGNKKVKGIR